MTDWRSKTCEDCNFRVGDECRRFPPGADQWETYYPVVDDGKFGFSEACAEHATILPIMPELNIKEAVR